MWTHAIGLLLATAFSLSLGSGGEIFDVTTIYDFSSFTDTRSFSSHGDVPGRVMPRTNARGMPLFDAVKTYKDIVSEKNTSQTFDLLCNTQTGNNRCNWKSEGWQLTPFYDNDRWRKMTKNEHYSLSDYVEVRFEHAPSNGINGYLFFRENYTTPIRNGGSIFLIKLYSYLTKTEINLRKCRRPLMTLLSSTIDIEVVDTDGQRITFGCDSLIGSLVITGRTTFSLEFRNSKLKFYKQDESDRTKQLVAEEDDQTMDIKYVVMTGGSVEKFIPLIKTSEEVYLSKKQDSEWVSPLISPLSRKLGLALVAHVNKGTDKILLDVLADDSTHDKLKLISVDNFKAGWNFKHLNLSIPDNFEIPLKIVIKKTDSTEMMISSISSYNLDEDEVKFLPSISINSTLLSEMKSSPSPLPVYTVNSPGGADIKPGMAEECLNGGVLTTAGCACPSGFFGPHCRTGCGENRFGRDCIGLCSYRSKGCRGLLMCTPYTGCSCGSGYTGSDCKEDCLSGKYGNDCSQECGHCTAENSCDQYTGRCTDCQFGYLPPYCQKEYVYCASKPEVSSMDNGTLVVKFNPKNVLGHGIPKIYQIQFREKASNPSSVWQTFTTKLIQPALSTNIIEHLEGLKFGVHYQVRVLLMDIGFNKYEGNRVPVSDVFTKCYVPAEYDYNITSDTSSGSLVFSWTYVNESEHWCPVEVYEVSWKEGWLWLTDFSQGTFTRPDFFPELPITFRVRAKTSGGFAPYSKTVTAFTQNNDLSKVEDLKQVSSQSTTAEVVWQPPIGSDGRPLQYLITYECMEQLACPPGCEDAAAVEVTTNTTSLTLGPLLPFSQYKVSVKPFQGLPTAIFVGTTEVLPTEVPKLSSQRPVRTNTSLSVYWDSVPICSSYIVGYNYQLLQEADNVKVLGSGFTAYPRASFGNLTAGTEYVVRVSVVTVAGSNPQNFLSINTSTSASAPEAVQELVVYKRSRTTLGLRWAEPLVLYGTLRTFTVEYAQGEEEMSDTLEPTHCKIWPHLYCHTLHDLKPNRKYNITVRATNTEVTEEGAAGFVVGLTKEGAPTAPEHVRAIHVSSHSVILEWDHPRFANGILRSFLLTVEETDSFDQDRCCEVYPLVDIPVTEEILTYSADVSDLYPASKYTISITAKTASMGPSQSIVVHTRPPHLPFTLVPSLNSSKQPDIRLLKTFPQSRRSDISDMNNLDMYFPLIRAHLLLVVDMKNETVWTDSGILEPKLDALLRQTMERPFLFYDEYNEVAFLKDSRWGQRPVHPLPPSYQLVAVQVTEYNGVYNADLFYLDNFSL